MNTQVTGRRNARRALALLGVVGVLGALALAARPMLEREDGEAHGFIDESSRALAAGDRGAATLALERARAVAPRAGFVRAAVDAAQIHEAETLASRAVRLVTSEEWSWLATALGWFAGLSLALAVVRKRPLLSRHQIAVSAALVLALAGLLGTSETSAAVVMTDAPIMVSPYAGAPIVGPLRAGTPVERESEHGAFVRVRSSDGLEGWIPQSRIEPIARRSS